MAHLFLPLTDSHFNKLSKILLSTAKVWWQKWSVNKNESITIQSCEILSSEINSAQKNIKLIDSFELKQSLFMSLTGLPKIEYKINEVWYLPVFDEMFSELTSSIINLLQEEIQNDTCDKSVYNDNIQPIKVSFVIGEMSFSYVLSRAFVGKILFSLGKSKTSLTPRVSVVKNEMMNMNIISSALSLKYEDFLSLNEGDVIMFNDGRIGECDLVSKDHNVLVSKVEVGTNNSDIVIKLK